MCVYCVCRSLETNGVERHGMHRVEEQGLLMEENDLSGKPAEPGRRAAVARRSRYVCVLLFYVSEFSVWACLLLTSAMHWLGYSSADRPSETPINTLSHSRCWSEIRPILESSAVQNPYELQTAASFGMSLGERIQLKCGCSTGNSCYWSRYAVLCSRSMWRSLIEDVYINALAFFRFAARLHLIKAQWISLTTTSVTHVW